MSRSSCRSARILVVDDVEPNRDLLTRLLNREGYVVSIALDGQSALDAVFRDAPDLILLDVMMPGLDGFEVCRALKANPATRLIPVVLVTALHDSGDRLRDPGRRR